MQRFGEILCELREDKGLTQLELSRILHISNSSISAYETGMREPNVEVLVSLATFFDVTTDYLLGIAPYNISPHTLTEKLADDYTVSDVIETLQALTPTQVAAVVDLLDSMKTCNDLSKQAVAERRRHRKK